MKNIAIILLAWMSIFQAGQDIYASKNAKVSLFSSAPLEDIAATSNAGTSVYNVTTGDIAFSVSIPTFQFKKSLMQSHFNSEYLESDKYPRANFKGKVGGQVDVNKNGSYPVTATGELDIHGVKQNRTINGTITVNNGTLTLASEFMVKCVDHNIEIPKIVFHNIAESIKMNVAATYTKVPAK